ncbi:hypothetical protein BU23DRAFT_484555, partial [Bimuria novae-zelandiae CBS 107.79]
QFPRHPVWNHPVFAHHAYAAFAQEVEASLDAEVAPSRLSILYQAIPLLADQLQAIDARNEQRIKELGTSIKEQMRVQSEAGLVPPQYRMCRAVRTVEDLWREWTVGLQGQPSISELDRRWGSTWRAGRRSELQWYSLRLEVIKEITRISQARRTSEEAAMWQLSQQQQQQRCSLDLFCKRLRAARKQR